MAKFLLLDFAHFYRLKIYPGMSLFGQIANGEQESTVWVYRMLLDEDNYWGEILFETEELPKERLLTLTHQVYREFYQPKEGRDRLPPQRLNRCV